MGSSCTEISYSNANLTDFVHQSMGPRCLSSGTTVVTTVVYTCILVAGFLGNLATAIVILKNSYMHTATNYYLFNLALADTTLLLLGGWLGQGCDAMGGGELSSAAQACPSNCTRC